MLTAHTLALRFNLDANKAYIAGILHDCAKDIDAVILIKIAKEIGIEINEVQKESPVKFLHSKVGAYKDIIVNCIKFDFLLEHNRIKVYNHLLIENNHL